MGIPYGGSGGYNNNGLFITGNTDHFRGKVIVESATHPNNTRDWLVFDEGGASHGFKNAEINLRTYANSGVLVRPQGSATDTDRGDFYFGALTGSGAVRNDIGTPTYYIGGMRTDAGAVDVFHGHFLNTTPKIIKQGAGTWILTGKQGTANNLGSVEITAGTLQIGDYGHTYAADDFYYTQGTTGTGANNTAAILPTAASVTVGANGTLAFGQSAQQEFRNPLTFAAGTSAISNENPNFSVYLGNVTANQGFTKVGAGRVILFETTNLGGNITVKEGTLQVVASRVAGMTMVLDGGIWDCSAADGLSSNANVAVTSAGGTIDYKSSTFQGIADAASGNTGKLTAVRTLGANHFGEGFNLGDLNNASVDTFKDFHGTIEAGKNAIVSVGAATNFENTTFIVTDFASKDTGLHFARGNKEYKIGDLSGEGQVISSKNPIHDNYTANVGYLNRDSTFSGAFVNNTADAGSVTVADININKVGTGTWTFGAASAGSVVDVDSVADITVKQGTLVLARNAGKASGKTLTVETGATLQLTDEGQKVTDLLTVTTGGRMVVRCFCRWMGVRCRSRPRGCCCCSALPPARCSIVRKRVGKYTQRPTVGPPLVKMAKCGTLRQCV